MLNTLFLLLIAGLVIFLLLSPRKEVPFIVLLHASIQYMMTLIYWLFEMNTYYAGILWCFILFSSLVLIWARGMNYSREMHRVEMFFSVSQWGILIAVLAFIGLNSPYYHMIPSASWSSQIHPSPVSIHPVAKLSGNVLMFTSFFQLILGWGRRWNLRKSVVELGPIILYFVLMGVLRVYEDDAQLFPFT
ncbi:MAG: hypothetical protein R8P61_02775 [Bacteroidia bacterium]|nr:hypothetical protein [Bacteroidia bacterium]